jgi:hypothetical protein
MDDDLRVEALTGFIDKREKLLSHIRNMTSKGRIDMGRMLQDEARKKYDIHTSESFALWMAGAWLESMERKSDAAQEIHYSLNELAEQLNEVQDDDSGENLKYSNDTNVDTKILLTIPDLTKCEPIKWFEIGNYAAVLVKDAPNIAGVSAPFEYIYAMALFSESSNLPIYHVTAERGLKGSVFLCTFDRKGNRENYGNDKDWSEIKTFAEMALSILHDEVNRLDGELETTDDKETHYNYDVFEDWYEMFKRTAGEVNIQLKQNDEGWSLIDVMEHEPLKRAFRDGVAPESLARDFAQQFDFSRFVRMNTSS